MPTPADELTRSALTLSAGEYSGAIGSYFPFWDSYFRPSLLESVERLPTGHFDYKPKPEMLTASQVILHIAETERLWIHHIVEREKFERFVVLHDDPSQGWVTNYDAPDHNALINHRHSSSDRITITAVTPFTFDPRLL